MVDAEKGDDFTGSSSGSLADLAFLDKDLLDVGATGNHGGNSGRGYAGAEDHVAFLEHMAIFNEIGNTFVCYFVAM